MVRSVVVNIEFFINIFIRVCYVLCQICLWIANDKCRPVCYAHCIVYHGWFWYLGSFCYRSWPRKSTLCKTFFYYFEFIKLSEWICSSFVHVFYLFWSAETHTWVYIPLTSIICYYVGTNNWCDFEYSCVPGGKTDA